MWNNGQKGLDIAPLSVHAASRMDRIRFQPHPACSSEGVCWSWSPSTAGVDALLLASFRFATLIE
ncbi:MAG: hypothetical protein Q8L49_09490 [Burkholderiaceae bacterium]|nr:hypothetical protein [Burkholderiaceae bacterium]